MLIKGVISRSIRILSPTAWPAVEKSQRAKKQHVALIPSLRRSIARVMFIGTAY